MMSSFYTGISGVKTQQFGLDVWGNNISNINTVGFRSSTPEFATLLSQYKNGIAMAGADEVGLGSTAQTTALSMKQGSIQTTDRTLDLAIQGNGFFGVQKAGDTATYYTRAGDFYVDANSNVLNGNGSFLLGTYSGNMTINKDGTASVAATSTASANMLTDPTKQVPLKFPKNLTHPGKAATAAVTASVPSYQISLTNGSASIPYTLPKYSTATLEIVDSSGAVVRTLKETSKGAGDHVATWDGKDTNGALLANGTYTVNMTYVDTPAVAAVGTGYLKDYMIDANGMVVATFDNGQSSIVAQIPVYHFQNEQGLEKLGDSEFRSTDNSGKAIFYKDANGNTIQESKILSQRLEMSNVSASEAMTNLIITEKAYSASAKIITTADQMIQKAINLKRG